MKYDRRLHPAAPRHNHVLQRRQMVVAAAGVGLVGLAASPPARAGNWALEAYAASCSVVAGSGTLVLYGRDPLAQPGQAATHSLHIVRLGAPDTTVYSSTLMLKNEVVPADAYATGCGWPVAFRLPVPDGTPSGLYLARIGSDMRGVEVPFVVRNSSTSRQRILVQVPFTTIQAYNPYGGKSLYDYNSSGGRAAPKVSFDRPLLYQAYETNDPWMPSFVRWLAKQGFGADFCTSTDLHADPGLLNGYGLLVTAGHDEYWSTPMRQAVDRFVQAQGNVAVFGGNTCWWQVRLEPGVRSRAANRTLVCYKSRQADPVKIEALKTINWINLQPPQPENTTFGLGSRLGAVWANGLPRPATPWLVKQPTHWVFAGTGLGLDAPFGEDFVGYETDAAAWRLGADKVPYPTGEDGTPAGLRILAQADCTSWPAKARALGADASGGYAAISVFSRGGTVFNAGTVDWALSLLPELAGRSSTIVGQITRNVINKLQTTFSEPKVNSVRDVRQFSRAQLNGDGQQHLFILGDERPAGWTPEPIVFRAAALAGVGTQSIYRYFVNQADGDGQRYHYSPATEVGDGWMKEGVAFHVPTHAGIGRIIVYQHHVVQRNGDGWRFLLSTQTAEPGWVLDGPVFYALAP